MCGCCLLLRDGGMKLGNTCFCPAQLCYLEVLVLRILFCRAEWSNIQLIHLWVLSASPMFKV